MVTSKGKIGHQGKYYRWSYILFKGNIPKDKIVCHSCDNGPWCINPDHLWLGTYSENMLDCLNKGRHGVQKEEVKLKISNTLKNRKFTEEWKKKISKAKLGHKTSQETRDKMPLSKISKPRCVTCIWINTCKKDYGVNDHTYACIEYKSKE